MGFRAEKDGTRQRGKINNVKLRVLDLSRVWTSSEKVTLELEEGKLNYRVCDTSLILVICRKDIGFFSARN